MTFTYDLSTDIGVMRLYLQDTDGAAPRWTDEELQYFLTDKGAVKPAVILALKLKELDFANPDYRDGQLEESDHAEAAATLRKLRQTLQNEFGISELTVSSGHVYRADSGQTEAPDYSEGI